MSSEWSLEQPWVNAEFDREKADNLVSMACFAVDNEAIKPRPASKIRNPDGSQQTETTAEFMRRMTETGVLYLLEMGLLVMPDDIDQRLENWFPVQRVKPGESE